MHQTNPSRMGRKRDRLAHLKRLEKPFFPIQSGDQIRASRLSARHFHDVHHPFDVRENVRWPKDTLAVEVASEFAWIVAFDSQGCGRCAFSWRDHFDDGRPVSRDQGKSPHRGDAHGHGQSNFCCFVHSFLKAKKPISAACYRMIIKPWACKGLPPFSCENRWPCAWPLTPDRPGEAHGVPLNRNRLRSLWPAAWRDAPVHDRLCVQKANLALHAHDEPGVLRSSPNALPGKPNRAKCSGSTAPVLCILCSRALHCIRRRWPRGRAVWSWCSRGSMRRS